MPTRKILILGASYGSLLGVKLALAGNFWCMRRVYGAVKEVRTPSAYLEPPVRIRAPRRRASGTFAPARAS